MTRYFPYGFADLETYIAREAEKNKQNMKDEEQNESLQGHFGE